MTNGFLERSSLVRARSQLRHSRQPILGMEQLVHAQFLHEHGALRKSATASSIHGATWRHQDLLPWLPSGLVSECGAPGALVSSRRKRSGGWEGAQMPISQMPCSLTQLSASLNPFSTHPKS